MTGSATELTNFIEWHFGWDKRDANFFWFWLKNTGIFIPLFDFRNLSDLYSETVKREESKEIKQVERQ